MYWAARSMPSVAAVDLAMTNLTVAFFATAPDHSTSRSASPSWFAPRSPGSAPFTVTCTVLAGNPILLRKPVQLLLDGWVRPAMAMLCPEPSIPAA